MARLGRTARPVAQLRFQLGQQLLAFFFEDGEQVGVDRVDGIDVVVDVLDLVRRCGRGAHRLGGQRGERLELGRGTEATEAADVGLPVGELFCLGLDGGHRCRRHDGRRRLDRRVDRDVDDRDVEVFAQVAFGRDRIQAAGRAHLVVGHLRCFS